MEDLLVELVTMKNPELIFDFFIHKESIELFGSFEFSKNFLYTFFNPHFSNPNL